MRWANKTNVPWCLAGRADLYEELVRATLRSKGGRALTMGESPRSALNHVMRSKLE